MPTSPLSNQTRRVLAKAYRSHRQEPQYRGHSVAFAADVLERHARSVPADDNAIPDAIEEVVLLLDEEGWKPHLAREFFEDAAATALRRLYGDPAATLGTRTPAAR